MILFHGSNQSIETVDLSKSRPNKDFGRAFYLSDNLEQAKQMADFKVEMEGGLPTINKYSFDAEAMEMQTLCVLRFDGYTEEWARFVFANRDAEQGSIVHGYDIVYGPIANDKVGRQIANLKDGYITFETFLERLKYMKGITFQYAFCTETAISKLVRL